MLSALSGSRTIVRVALRETRILRRSRAARLAAFFVLALAWLPPLLVSLRSGSLGLASFEESANLTLALLGVVVPLMALLAGCSLLASEIEDRSIVPVLVAPVSRRALVAGKLLGLGSVLIAVYATAFASVGLTLGGVRGPAGARFYLAVVFSGALLGATCLLLGAAFGASGRGRVRAFGTALASWLVLVFALDAAVLALVLSTAPPSPASVGHHGHDEIAAVSSNEAPATRPSVVWMVAGPLALFRLSASALAPGLGSPVGELVEGNRPAALAALVIGWLLWLAVPTLAVFHRFQRLALG